MEYKEALEIGLVRARRAAEAIERSGAKACAVCAVKPEADAGGGRPGDWEPVGERSWKDVARDEGFTGGGGYHLIVVDEDGVAKASTVERFGIPEILWLAEGMPMPLADPGHGELWCLMGQEEDRRDARDWALHTET